MHGRRPSTTRRAPLSLSSRKNNAELAAVRILVGPERREFIIGRKLLVSSCKFFRELVGASRVEIEKGEARHIVSLRDQCPEMFKLFHYWIYERKGFHDFIDEADADDSCSELHWDLVNLHLFAAQIQLPALQDFAMDAIQDLYLRCNWDIVPELVQYVYQVCDAQVSYRLRKWIVAMTTWLLGGVQREFVADPIQDLFDTCPGFWEEYVTHLLKMSNCKHLFHFKNPQLRLPSNNLRNEERQFGYRQCSFHTHRSKVGQGNCPHTFPPLAPATLPSPTPPLTDGDIKSKGTDSPDASSESSVLSPSSDSIFDMYLDAR
ncbi:hypothetical protein DL767_006997 [Monosporascus sp. MG133]|nr:hypothetical protein DL767_006997 [Monosporascus sp. MG133]